MRPMLLLMSKYYALEFHRDYDHTNTVGFPLLERPNKRRTMLFLKESEGSFPL